MKNSNRILRILIFLILVININAQNQIKLTKIVSGLTRPVFLTHAEDDRLFVIEQIGKIRIIKNGILQQEPFLNITERVNARGNEQGLLGLAFDPDYKSNGYFYVNYTSTGANRTIVSRFRMTPNNPDRADSLSELIFLTVNQPAANHNGGCIKFGPDGYLYIGMGDGGGSNDQFGNGQNKKSLLAKMLRIDVRNTDKYKIPADNPFIKDTNYLPEIWAMGLRNPWRYSFDRLTNDLWIGDVGQNIWEEVDYVSSNSKGGENYGWPCYEGLADFNLAGCSAKSNYIFPKQVYRHSTADGCSVTGGYVYRGSECSYLFGEYLFGDFCSGSIWAMHRLGALDSFTNRLVYKHTANQLSSFGEDAKGELYMCAFGPSNMPTEGAIYKISDTCFFDYKISYTNPDCDSVSDGKIFIDAKCNYDYSWSNGQIGSSISDLVQGTYTVTISYSGCTKSEKVDLQNMVNSDSICITPLFVSEICQGDSAILIACDAKNKIYQWFRNGELIPSLSGKRVFVKDPGNYQVRVEDSTYQGCYSDLSNTREIVVHPLPPKPKISQSGDSLISDPGYNSYVWYLNGTIHSGSIINYFNIITKGYYQVEVIDSNHCRSQRSDSIYVIPTNIQELIKSSVVVLPNPSSNIIVFYFGDWIKTEATIKIYNSEGRKILEKNIIEGISNWDLDISNFPSSVYYYSVDSKASSQQIKTGKIVKL